MKLTDAYTFRPATNDDLLAIRAVLFSVRCEIGVVDETGKSDKDLNDLAQNYLEGGGGFELIVDRRSNRIVGCAGLRPQSRRRAELCKMYILKSARGRGCLANVCWRICWKRFAGVALRKCGWRPTLC